MKISLMIMVAYLLGLVVGIRFIDTLFNLIFRPQGNRQNRPESH